MKSFSSYEISNFIVDFCVNEKMKINNLKLNAIIAFMYYNSRRVYGVSFVSNIPIKNGQFYVIEETYERFRYMGAEPIESLPSDFDFMVLLSKDFRASDIRKHSHEMLERIAVVRDTIGDYIVSVVSALSGQDIFAINEIIDLECDYPYEK